MRRSVAAVWFQYFLPVVDDRYLSHPVVHPPQQSDGGDVMTRKFGVRGLGRPQKRRRKYRPVFIQRQDSDLT